PARYWRGCGDPCEQQGESYMRPGRVCGSVLSIALIGGWFATAAAQTQPPPPAVPKRPPAAAKEVQKAAPAVPAPAHAAQAPAAQAPATPSAPLPAAPDNGPSSTTAVYGDWVVRCGQQAGTRICEVAQTIYVQGQQTPIALIAIGREKQGDP